MVLPPPTRREEVAMLEAYFIKPTTIDRIQASWIQGFGIVDLAVM
jgi:hypothetical protein